MASITYEAPAEAVEIDERPWWRQLTGYHWLVFAVASAAWFFDCLDQRLFSLARIPALASLMNSSAADVHVQAFGKVVTAYFLVGWGIGGLIFGPLGDKFGRTKMLTTTILIYSVFTGLSFFSVGRWDFTIFRFFTGLGVGGVFGLAVSLIAETVSAGARPHVLGLLQVLSSIGNLTAGFVKMLLDSLAGSNVIAPGQTWRYMFLVGALPAAMVVLTMFFLREPERWLRLKEQGLLPKGGLLGPYVTLAKSKRWRYNLIIGTLIASTGVVGLWAISEYAVDLQRSVFASYYAAQQVPAGEIKAHVEHTVTIVYMLNMLGAATGMWIFTKVAASMGRRTAFLIGFGACLVVNFLVFWKMNSPMDAYWMMPLLGAAQLSVFAGFAIYLPELFPSGERSTGTSFCYNLGRFAAAGGSFFSSMLTQKVFAGYTSVAHPSPAPLRYSAMVMCSIFLVGLLTLPFAPETKGQPLPE
jgi:MFS family permease